MKELTIILVAFVLIGCKNQQQEELNVELEQEIEELMAELEESLIEEEVPDPIPNQNWWITPTSVGAFNLGDSVPQEGRFENYEVKYITFEQQEEEGPNMETMHKVVVLENGKKALEITPSVYQNKPHLIEEMRVFSEKFNTNENISVGSTIQEFYDTYPKAKIWYTYVSDRMVMETGTMDLQFELSTEDYIPELTIETDMDEKEKNDFKPETKIKSIRIY